MVITHIVDDFLFELFPEAENDTEKLTSILKRYYTLGPFEPEVELKDSTIEVSIDVDRINADKGKFDKLVKYAESGKLDKAIELADELIENAPNISEYHRVRGQAYSEKGDQEEAINSLIDALKWNPKNEWALLMIGNIYARFKQDMETALKYFDKVLEVKPDDYHALNNIGVQLFETGRKEEALEYLNKALEANPKYPNTLFAFAMIAYRENDYSKAFEYSTKSLRNQDKKDELYDNAVKMALSSAKELTGEIDGLGIAEEYMQSLSDRFDVDIKMEADPEIPTAATMQYAEVYQRNHHLIKYKPNHPAVAHLVVHELMHLELREEARVENVNKLFTTTDSTKASFRLTFKKDAERLKKKGVPESNVRGFMDSMADGLNRQVFNTPIDVFIEDRIYNRFEEIRSFQLLSLHANTMEGADANTRPDIIKNAPNKVISASTTYGLVHALQLKDLFGLDLIGEFKPKRKEVETATKFYEEYLEHKDDKEAGIEYDLIQFWAEDLNLDRYFNLVDEKSQNNSADSVLDKIESDPYGLDEDDPSKDRKMKTFIEKHGGDDINMAVAMYMVGALQYFEGMDKSKIKEIAFDIAKVGTAGIDPKKDGYRIPSIPDSNFSGYQTLAYFYVSWTLAIPEMVPSLGLSFKEEYEVACEFNSL
ncbi:MAG: tetratricopeptide repeat protein [Gracilimonas sp.]|uniref:tetratricopeptide repeat protein n=1 Tax=Gracilimonas sp. TaxID=1974203 RepID=UPI00375367F6|nr:tetratricopeptide repeat protein [Gracilimonas sp.]